MTIIIPDKIKNIGEIKQYTKNVHICPICKKNFYSKDLRLIYCSEVCREIGYKIQQQKNQKEYYHRHIGNIYTHQHRIYLKNIKNI